MSQTKAQLISDLVQALNFTGTASAPSNGAFLSAANTLAFATNSAQRLTIDSSGKVGIGTTSPETLLHAKINTFSDDINKVALTLSNNQSSGVHQYFQNASTGTGVSNGARIGLGNTDNFLIQHFEAKDIQISTNGTERMRINSSGNVGIGISSSIDRALHIVNNSGAIVKMEANYSGSVTGIEGVLTASGANRYVVGMYGKVVNTSSTESDVARIRFYNEQASPTSSDSPGYITFDTTPDGSATPTERMRISSAGNVGIGTTSPGEKLDVAGTIQLTNFLKATGDLLLCADIDNNNSGTALRFCVDGDQSAEKMRIDDSGNVGIGTTSPTKPSSSNANTRFMEISSADGADLILGNSATSVSVGDHIGTLAFKNVDSNPDSGVPHYAGIRCESANTSGSMDLRFYVGRGNLESDATNMIISAAGNVGIGTSSPDVNFHVSGTSSVAKIESTASATSARLIIKSETDTYTGLHFGDTGDDDVGRIRYYHTDNHMQFSTGASERLRIDSDGKVAIGTTATSMNGNGLKIYHTNFPSLQLQNNATGTGATVGAEFILSSGGALQLVQRSSEAMIFKTTNIERMRISNTGVLSIGTTSPNGSASKLQVEDSGENNVYFVGNTTTAGARLILQNKNTTANSSTGVLGADAGGQTTASIRFYSADDANNEGYLTLETRPSGGLPTERMRISSAGNVGINTNSPDRLLHVNDTNNTSHVTPFRLTNAAGSPGTEVRMEFECGLDEIAYISAKNEGSDIGPLIFATASSQNAYPTEKARIRQNGAFGVGTNANRVIHAIQNSSHGTVGVGAFENGDSSNNHAVIFLATVRDGNAGESFLQCNRDQDNNGQGVKAVAFIRTNGDFDSDTNSYGGISDITLKENIVDAKSQWDDIKNVKVRNFNFKDNPDQKMLGVVAQEIETVCSGLVKETSDEGTTLKSVKYSILYMKAIKALQEAMTRIETLETEVAALKAA